MQPLHPTDPRRVGRYRLTHRLGAGGMGRVYLALTPASRRIVVKVVLTEYADEPDFRARFAREVEAARRVGGFHTAPVVDADPEAESPWIASAFIPGPSLGRAVREHGPLPEPALRALAAGLTEGLEAIHACGLIHRDLKPDNIILASDGPRIIDFGIARAPDAARVTMTGMPVGTPSYMSPEQTEGAVVGPSSDVFSMGTVLAYAATGTNPFAAQSVPAVIRRLIGPAPEPEGVPGPLRDLVAACWRHAPAARPAPVEILSLFGDDDLSGAWPPPHLAGPGPESAPPATGVPAPGTAPPTGSPAPLPPPDTAAPGTRSDALTVLEDRARAAAQTGDPSAALHAYRALLLEQLRVLGPHHHGTLSTRREIAHWTGARGDVEDARHGYEALLVETERVLGPDHLETLRTRRHAALLVDRVHGHDRALRVAAPLLRDHARVLGGDHPETLALRFRVVQWEASGGDRAGALAALRSLLDDMLRVLGPEHAETLRCRAYVAHWSGWAGDPHGAVGQLLTLLSDQARVLGPDHEDTDRTRALLGEWRSVTDSPDRRF
ncbi:protein kinase domain-containing protein [Nocardiopsis tropica]|uniref:Protein kinase n=1 Tax=Nocardiopsis tropica TaxID=109330 RepID=A0ABU7KS97_9ACTN|nr:protein kinase [Nocardiopsis umidischolae]MEE2052176.1 protein kinase [Nocardiopsis umidischolae]